MALLSIGELLGIGPDQLSGFIPYTAVEGSGGLISGINGSGLSGLGGGGADPSAVSAIASAYAESAASGKLDNSASGLWYPMTGNPSGFLTSVNLDGYATTEYVDSSLSGKMDTSEASAFYPMSGNPSGFLTSHQSLDGYATTEYVDSSVSGKVDQSAFDDCCSSVQSALSGKLDNSASSTWYPMTGNPSGFISDADLSDYATKSYVDSGLSGKEDKLTWGTRASGGTNYVTSVNNSSFSAKSTPTSYLLADQGLKYTFSGTTGILQLDSKGDSSISSITGLGGSALKSNPSYVSLMTTGLYYANDETASPSEIYAVGDTTNHTVAFSRVLHSIYTSGASSSTSDYATGYSTANLNIYHGSDAARWGMIYYPKYAPLGPSPSPVFPSSVAWIDREYSAQFEYNSSIGSDEVWVVSFDLNRQSASALHPYTADEAIPSGCGIARSGQYSYGTLSNVSATSTGSGTYTIQVLSQRGPMAYTPSGNWLQVNNGFFSVGPTTSNYGLVEDFAVKNEFTATAISQTIPLSAGIVPTGSTPMLINWAGKISAPFGMTLYLVEDYSSTVGAPSGSSVVAMDYVPVGNYVAKFNAITKGYGNGTVCTGMYVSAVFDTAPSDNVIQISEQYGSYSKLTIGTVLGSF